MKVINFSIIIVLCLIASSNAYSQSEEELAKQTQNPVADLISLPFQNNTDFNLGPNDRTKNTLNIQPVIPIKLNDNWNLITRTILPLIYQPDINDNDGGEFGIGDTTFTAFFSPRNSKRLIWGAGPVFLIPTATDDVLGTEKWAAGPSFVGLITPTPWVVGFLASNIWSFAGDSDRSDLNLFTLQYFINYNLPHGWYLVSAPIITANWEANSDNTWTVPFGGGAGKVFKLGNQPINVQSQAFYNIEKPENGPEWQLRFQIQFLFPKG